MSCKELIWFYMAKIDGHTPARPSPRGTEGVQSSKQLTPGSCFPRGIASGCGQEAEPSLQLFSIRPHCPPLSKMRQKSAALPAPCGTEVPPHQGKRGCPLALTVATKK